MDAGKKHQQEMLAQLVKYVQFSAIIFVLAAEYLAANFQVPIPPDILEWYGCDFYDVNMGVN